MDFCSSCGFLLPLESVGKSNKCRPCLRTEQSSTNYVCLCYICKDRSGIENKIKPNDGRSETRLADESLSEHGHEEEEMNDEDDGWHAGNDVCHQDWALQTSTSMELEDKGVDWSEAPCDPSMNADDDDANEGYSVDDFDDDFFVNTKETASKGSKVASSPMATELFERHDFPPLQRGLKENFIEKNAHSMWQRMQENFKTKIIRKDTPDIALLVAGRHRKPKKRRYYVGGVDISFIKDNNKDACACLSVVSLPKLELVYQAMEMVELTQPYIPGFLAFREVPSLIKLFNDLEINAPKYIPDVIMVDGNGILHPRGCGLASQLGVVLDVPTIGVAKTLMSAQGIVDNDAHKEKKRKLDAAGQGFDLISEESGRVLGKCVRVHDQAPNPVYVSVGHKITLKSAVWLVLECSKYRIPEPIRLADLDSREYIRLGNTKPKVFIKN